MTSCVPFPTLVHVPKPCPIKIIFEFMGNVHLGLKRGELGDVFAVYDYDPEEEKFRESDISFLQDEEFVKNFTQLYKITPDTTFHKFSIIGPNLYMEFRGENVETLDAVTVFKWVIKGDGLEYVDARAKSQYINEAFPKQYNFEWRRPPRSAARHGINPHISIEDRVFVECVGGDLTIKIEDNTSSGEGILSFASSSKVIRRSSPKANSSRGRSNLLLIVPLLSSAARIPFPFATSAWAVWTNRCLSINHLSFPYYLSYV